MDMADADRRNLVTYRAANLLAKQLALFFHSGDGKVIGIGVASY